MKSNFYHVPPFPLGDAGIKVMRGIVPKLFDIESHLPKNCVKYIIVDLCPVCVGGAFDKCVIF